MFWVFVTLKRTRCYSSISKKYHYLKFPFVYFYWFIVYCYVVLSSAYFPYSLFQVGVDNMCILVHAVKRQQLELPLELKISNALGDVGPSITLASLSEVLAFAVGGFLSMPACRVFSMFAGEIIFSISSYIS